MTVRRCLSPAKSVPATSASIQHQYAAGREQQMIDMVTPLVGERGTWCAAANATRLKPPARRGARPALIRAPTQ